MSIDKNENLSFSINEREGMFSLPQPCPTKNAKDSQCLGITRKYL